jgi:hypothetical protein
MADADNYKIKIKDLALFVRNVQLSPAVRMGHVKAFEKTRIVTFVGNLSSAHVQCHTIDLVVSKVERDSRNSPI